MKDYQISPGQIPHLLRTVADVFRNMMEEVKSPNNLSINLKKESDHMHFMADLLKDLVETAYPIEESKDKYNPSNDVIDALIYALDLKPIDKSIIRNIEKDFESIAKMMKDYKPPKAGEF